MICFLLYHKHWYRPLTHGVFYYLIPSQKWLMPYPSQCKQKLQSLKDEISQWRKDQFHNWCRLTQSAIDATGEDCSAGDCLTFDSSGSLLRLSTADGRLRVGYPDGLVRLQREVRLLSGLGYSVPQRLHEVAAKAEALCRHAVVLKQVRPSTLSTFMLHSRQITTGDPFWALPKTVVFLPNLPYNLLVVLHENNSHLVQRPVVSSTSITFACKFVPIAKVIIQCKWVTIQTRRPTL